MAEKEISRATLKRLPTYLSYLKSISGDEHVNISATALAGALHMGEVQVRKDLALVSDGGRPKIGYNREKLIADIEGGIKKEVSVGCAMGQARCSICGEPYGTGTDWERAGRWRSWRYASAQRRRGFPPC